ncbi:PI-PLC domain-containing protein [Candidimonas nitroreducens]|uniref:Uncharacterized protein n=1 Tax=Candidimonas nitroreducens TaxID=683354 RepID=A0A225LZ76_9BURK|nr:hypothetical protein [Candidimonas nitroreducens]OWT54455.1 hypothetical protein CEY11_22265 [Candidimonas nitroreducens]
MIRNFLTICFLPLALFSGAVQAETLYYNIAHAINHSKYIDWAVREGANGIEADLRFTDDGEVLKFQHGSPCECRFPNLWGVLWKETEVCQQMMSVDPTYRPDPLLPDTVTVKSAKDACLVNETSRGFLNTLAGKSAIALFIVDSKVGDSVAKNDTARSAAGRNVIAALVADLFDKGYKGKVIVGVDKSKFQAYSKAAAEAARATRYADRIYISFDEDGNSTKKARATIDLLTSFAAGKAVYGNGVTANWRGDFEDSFKAGVDAESKGSVRMNYIWTLDKVASMTDYLALGVRGIMTNSPKNVMTALQPFTAPGKNGRMAKPEDPL